MKVQTIFERTEIKYIITLKQREALLKLISSYIKPDEYGESTVCSLYFDTDDFLLIRNSMDKPVYKEKLRLRSYSTPKRDSNVFLELKKKYRGVVYKRRQTLRYSDAMDYILNDELPNDSQIENLDLAKGSYGEKILQPNLCIMEIKSLNTMPLWLTSALNELKIFPGSFSKYGTAYRIVTERNQMMGGTNCA